MKDAPNAGASDRGSIWARALAVSAASLGAITPAALGSPAKRVPDSEEIEPLGRSLAHDALEDGHPRPEGVLLASRRDDEWLEHPDRIPLVGVQRAKCRNDGDGGGAGQSEGTDRKRRRATEEWHPHVAAISEGAVALQRHGFTATERRHEGE